MAWSGVVTSGRQAVQACAIMYTLHGWWRGYPAFHVASGVKSLVE
jgi:hypothetical protein